MLPFLIDVVGNALDLYDSIDWWDDLNHFVNWGILTTAFGLLLIRLPLGRLNIAGLMVGFGAVTAVLWEFAEYFTFIRGGPEEADGLHGHARRPALGLSGSAVAARAHRVTVLWRSQKEPGTNRFRSGWRAVVEDAELLDEVKNARERRLVRALGDLVPVDLLAKRARDLEDALVVDLVLGSERSFVTISPRAPSPAS